MAKRLRECAEMLLARVVQGGSPRRKGGLFWVLPVVVYNGSKPWTAVGQESGLTPLSSEQARADLALLQPQAYRLWARWSLDFRGAVSGGLALGQPGLGDGAAANGGGGAGFAAAAFGVIGPLSRAGERSVSTGAPHLARALWEYKTVSGVGFPTFEELERAKKERS